MKKRVIILKDQPQRGLACNLNYCYDRQKQEDARLANGKANVPGGYERLKEGVEATKVLFAIVPIDPVTTQPNLKEGYPGYTFNHDVVMFYEDGTETC